jgi:hypothetical protein
MGCSVRCLPVTNRTDLLQAVMLDAPHVVLISALPPFSDGKARSICRLIRSRQPEVKIILCLWGYDGGTGNPQERLESGCADGTLISLEQVISSLVSMKTNVHRTDAQNGPGGLTREGLGVKL